MKKTILSAALLAAAAASPAALAQGWYVDGGYTFLNVEDDEGGSSVDVDLGAIGGHVGYDFNNVFGVEGEVLIGVGDDDVTVLGEQVNVELKSSVGAFAKAQLPLGEQVRVFGRAGIVQAEIEASIPGVGSDSASETGFAYGVGAALDLASNLYVRGDYTRYDIEDAEADAFMIGLGLLF